MRSILSNAIAGFIICALLTMSSCKKDKCTQTVTYKTYVPVYMSYTDMRNGVKICAAQPLKTPGKIYLKGNYIFVNEVNQGIHVIDNTNPSAPQNIAFIAIPGNVDIAANGNTLYADSYIDLLAFNISDISNITLSKRVQSALPYNFNSNGYTVIVDSTQGVVASWKEQLVTQKINGNCTNQPGTNLPGGGPIFYDAFTNSVTPASTTGTTTYGNGNTPGTGGSTARFTVASNTLYVVDNSTLHVFDVTNTTSPQHINDENIGWSIETIFPYGNHLFIGSSSGFYIYDITNPQNPNYISEYSHITACDPVTTDGHYAYFTLSGDAPCHQNINELDIVDISNIATPALVTTVPMADPKGVGVDGQTLFVCDSKDGLKVYSTANLAQAQLNLTAQFGNINSFDVIPYNKDLIMVGSGGLYQYNYSNVQNITLTSTIPVTSN